MRDKDRQRIISLIDDACISETQRREIDIDIPILQSVEIALRGNIIERFEKAFPKERTPECTKKCKICKARMNPVYDETEMRIQIGWECLECEYFESYHIFYPTQLQGHKPTQVPPNAPPKSKKNSSDALAVFKSGGSNGSANIYFGAFPFLI